MSGMSISNIVSSAVHSLSHPVETLKNLVGNMNGRKATAADPKQSKVEFERAKPASGKTMTPGIKIGNREAKVGASNQQVSWKDHKLSDNASKMAGNLAKDSKFSVQDQALKDEIASLDEQMNELYNAFKNKPELGNNPDNVNYVAKLTEERAQLVNLEASKSQGQSGRAELKEMIKADPKAARELYTVLSHQQSSIMDKMIAGEATEKDIARMPVLGSELASLGVAFKEATGSNISGLNFIT